MNWLQESGVAKIGTSRQRGTGSKKKVSLDRQTNVAASTENVLTIQCGFDGNIETITRENTAYRRVLYTTAHLQLVVMNLNPRQEIGIEEHPEHTQFIRVERGTGWAMINRKLIQIEDGSVVVVPPGVRHNFFTGKRSNLKMYVIYAPPMHEPGLVEQEKPRS